MPSGQRNLTSSPNNNTLNNNSNNNNTRNNGSSSRGISQQEQHSLNHPDPGPASSSSSSTAKSSSMHLYSKRLASYKTSPAEMRDERKQLAAAGFYYTGRGDVVQCAFCSGKLHKSKIGDLPMIEHERFFGGCSFVKRNGAGGLTERGSGSGYEEEQRVNVDDQKETFNDDKQPPNGDSLIGYITHLKRENEAMRDAMTCIVCRTASVHTLMLPCQHLVCCDKCGLAAKQCPKCRGKIGQKISTFMV